MDNLAVEERRLARNAYMREWKKRSKASVNASNQKWKDANRELVRERERGYAKKARVENPARQAAADKRYREAHPEVRPRLNKAWFAAHPEYVAQYRVKRLNAHIFKSAKCRAKQNGIPFTITEEDIHVPDVCPALGIPLDRAAIRGEVNAVTIDRVIPALGYVPGNVRIISRRANQIKLNASADELEKIAAYIRAHIEANPI